MSTAPSKRERARQRRIDLQGGLCHWCDAPLTTQPEGKPGHRLATDDHVFPRNDSRRFDRSNPLAVKIVAACRKCNHDRGATPYDEFLALKRPEWRDA